MSKKAPSLLAICPFYKDEDKQRIYCEGQEPCSSTIQAFATPEQKRAFALRACKTWEYAEECSTARALEGKYEKQKE